MFGYFSVVCGYLCGVVNNVYSNEDFFTIFKYDDFILFYFILFYFISSAYSNMTGLIYLSFLNKTYNPYSIFIVVALSCDIVSGL